MTGVGRSYFTKFHQKKLIEQRNVASLKSGILNYEGDGSSSSFDSKASWLEKKRLKADAIVYFQNELDLKARNSEDPWLYKGISKMRNKRHLSNSINFDYKNKESLDVYHYNDVRQRNKKKSIDNYKANQQQKREEKLEEAKRKEEEIRKANEKRQNRNNEMIVTEEEEYGSEMES